MGSISGTVGVDPQLAASWSGSVNMPYFSGSNELGQLEVTYYAVVVPADPTNPVSVPSVPLLLSFSASTSCSNTDPTGHVDQATASWSVSDPAGTLSGGCSLGVATGNGSYQQSFSVQPNQQFMIQASVGANANSNTTDSSQPLAFKPVSESTSVNLDPLTQIDPTFAFANDFLIEVSPRLDAGVPEPGFALPLGAALLGIAMPVAQRRRTYRWLSARG
jgi:hypothetical protein